MEPVLKIVPREQIVPIMESNPDRVAYLEIAFTEAGYIFNPLLVSESRENTYFLMEDGSCLEAIARLDVDFVPVQIAPISRGSFLSGNVPVQEWTDDYFLEFHNVFPRDTIIILADSCNPRSTVYARSYDGNRPCEGLSLCRENGCHISRILIDFFSFLRQRTLIAGSKVRLFGPAPTDSKSGPSTVKIGNLQVSDVVRLGQSGFHFPIGFYRPEGISRVLGVNYPIKVLQEKATVSDKQSFLQELIALRMKSGRAESFSGGVILLNY